MVNAGPEQGNWTYGYDNNGNMIGEKKGATFQRQFEYNYDDRMTHFYNPGDDLAFEEYDAMGRRLIHTDGITGQQTLYYYDGIRVILEKRKNGQNWQTSKVYTLQDGVIGFIIAEITLNPAGLTMWYHYDRLGNVMDLTDEDGTISTSYDQDAFGNVLSGSASGYHLITKEYSPPIGLYYFCSRWYDPKIAKYLTRSSLSPVLEHPYVFVVNNPISLVDPTGEVAVLPALKACLANRWCRGAIMCLASAIGTGAGSLFWDLVYGNDINWCSIGCATICACLTAGVSSTLPDDPVVGLLVGLLGFNFLNEGCVKTCEEAFCCE